MHFCWQVFDPKLETNVVLDASDHGLGAVLQQKRQRCKRRITSTSVLQTHTERQYSNGERQILTSLYPIEG